MHRAHTDSFYYLPVLLYCEFLKITMAYCLTYNTFDLSSFRDQSSPQQQQQEAPGATRSRRALGEPEKQRLSKEVSAFTADQYRHTHKTTTSVFTELDSIMGGSYFYSPITYPLYSQEYSLSLHE